MSEEPGRYQLGPRSRRGLVAGWRGGQLAAVAVGLVVGVAALRSLGGASGALAAVVVVGSAVAFASWPVAGRTPEQWVPAALGHAARRTTVARPGRARGPLEHLALDDLVAEATGRRIGVVVDQVAQTWTAALRVGGAGFALLDDTERDRRVAAWSGVLAAVAREGGSVHRLQWIARTFPTGAGHGLDPGPVAGRSTAAVHYGALLEHAAPRLWDHEVLVGLTVRTPPPRRRGAAGQPALVEELGSLERRLRAAGLEVDGALSPAALAGAIRRATSVPDAPTGLADAWPWPLGVEATWSMVRTDATWHAVYWVAEWPRSDVKAGFLLPLLVEGGVRRTLAVTMAPVPSLRAVRRAEHDRTSGAADAELRRRHGFAVTERARHEHETTARRERELAEGHASFRFSGYVAVTATDEHALASACGRVEQAAALAQLELHRLYGSQEEGLSFTLPTGRGCS